IPTSIDLGPDIIACESDIVDINWNYDPALTYLWNSGQTTPEITVTQGAVYTLRALDSVCYIYDSILVAIGVPDIIDNYIDLDGIGCAGGGAINGVYAEKGTPPYTYNWYKDGQLAYSSPDSNATELYAGDYQLIVVDAGGCVDSSELYTIDSSVNLYSIKPSDTTIHIGESVQFEVTVTGVLLEWLNPDYLDCNTCLTPVATPLETTTFTLIIKNKDDPCFDTAFITVYVEVDTALFVPDAFTPNDDGINDIFYLYGKDVKSVHFMIYDRWGEKIFESDQLSKGWDGWYNGHVMNSGLYIVIYKAEFLNEVIVPSAKKTIKLIR
ncbi:MAG: gliding motility-associated C-terminal domain-containing protein, partial [Bacteroidetes bacterium]|nr:gliding motility-associated C-terminal domain-containing protein [Bacteroidota bacterium]